MSVSQTGKQRSKSAIEKISGKNSVAHRVEVKNAKKKWWDDLKSHPQKYKQFCQERVMKRLCKEL